MAITSDPIAANLGQLTPAFQISILVSNRSSVSERGLRTSEVRKTASNHVCPWVLDGRQQLSAAQR